MLSNSLLVKTETNIKPKDLGFDTSEQLDAWIEDRLKEITEFIYEITNNKFDNAEEAPLGMHLVATQMAHNLIMSALSTRSTPVIRVENWDVRINTSKVYTEDIKKLLEPYHRGEKISFILVGSEISTEEEDEV